MKNTKSSESRRKLLKSITAGSGAIVAGKSLPESWSRPIVDSVMLPAHAQTSGEYYCSDFDAEYGVFSVRLSGDTAYVTGVMGGWSNHAPTETYKYEWIGTAQRINSEQWAGTLSVTNLGTTSCTPGSSFRENRDMIFSLNQNNASNPILNVAEGDGSFYLYYLNPSSSECSLPSVTDCT